MPNPPTIDPSADFKNLVDLLGVYKEAKGRLAVLETELDQEFTELVESVRKEYGELQDTVTKAEAAITLLVTRNPAWFAAEKSVKTPDGSVSSRKTTRHEAPNEKQAILRIQAAIEGAEYANDGDLLRRLESLLRVETTINFESAASFSEAELAKFGIVRIVDESVTVKEAKVNLGRAVKSLAAAEAKKASKAAKSQPVEAAAA